MGRDVSKHAIQDAQSIDLKSSWREMEIASTSPMWEPRRMLCTQNDNYANSFTASTDVSTRKCFVQIQLRVINFHPWFQCFVPKRVHAILQDTHIGDVNAVFRRSME